MSDILLTKYTYTLCLGTELEMDRLADAKDCGNAQFTDDVKQVVRVPKTYEDLFLYTLNFFFFLVVEKGLGREIHQQLARTFVLVKLVL